MVPSSSLRPNSNAPKQPRSLSPQQRLVLELAIVVLMLAQYLIGQAGHENARDEVTPHGTCECPPEQLV